MINLNVQGEKNLKPVINLEKIPPKVVFFFNIEYLSIKWKI
jgi:hypothetical protein